MNIVFSRFLADLENSLLDFYKILMINKMLRKGDCAAILKFKITDDTQDIRFRIIGVRSDTFSNNAPVVIVDKKIGHRSWTFDFRLITRTWKKRKVSTKQTPDPHLKRLHTQKLVYRYSLLEKLPMEQPGIYSISGGRQIGKTTLLKQYMNGKWCQILISD